MNISTHRLTFGLAVFLLVVGVLFPNYPGSAHVYVCFNVAYFSLFALILPRPRIHSYTFVAGLLFLGFWLKFVLHTAISYSFNEPVGAFDGGGDHWDQALLAASAGAVGCIVVRLLHLRYAAPRGSHALGDVPRWYPRIRRLLWVGGLSLMVAVAIANFVWAFHKVGVNPKLILPYHCNILPAWLINVGFALGFATMMHWELILYRKSTAALCLVPLLEGLATSISSLSRATYLFHTIPYLFSIGSYRSSGLSLTRTGASLLFAVWLGGFAVSLGFANMLREYAYQPGHDTQVISDVGLAADASTKFDVAVRETRWAIRRLVVDRWIGLEGTLAVASYSGIGKDLLRAGLAEDPRKGADSLYQEISKSPYGTSLYADYRERGLTFLSAPGPIAVLFYSGSLLVVGVGMAIVLAFMLALEMLGEVLLGNPLLCAMVGASGANVVCQTNFPYLTLVFFIQLLVALVFLALLQRSGRSAAKCRGEPL